MNFDDATKACIELGEGWRVPNRIDLHLMFDNLNTIKLYYKIDE
jgi:hypothetical protein